MIEMMLVPGRLKSIDPPDPIIPAKYIGEILASNFITGQELASQVGMTNGVLINSDTPWIHMTMDGKDLFFPIKPIRHTVTYNTLSAANVISGSRSITINGELYKVRLFKTLKDDTKNTTPINGFDVTTTHGSEWNRLMYHISGKPFKSPSNTFGSEGITEGDLARYTETALVTHSSFGLGSWIICQEQPLGNNIYRWMRGGEGASGVGYTRLDEVWNAMGWRPILERIPSVV